MANFVVKSNSNKEFFDVSKVKKTVEKAARDASLPEEEISKIVDQISAEVIKFTANLKEISTEEIRARVLSHLDVISPEVSKAWKEYDKKNKGK